MQMSRRLFALGCFAVLSIALLQFHPMQAQTRNAAQQRVTVTGTIVPSTIFYNGFTLKTEKNSNNVVRVILSASTVIVRNGEKVTRGALQSNISVQVAGEFSRAAYSSLEFRATTVTILPAVQSNSAQVHQPSSVFRSAQIQKRYGAPSPSPREILPPIDSPNSHSPVTQGGLRSGNGYSISRNGVSRSQVGRTTPPGTSGPCPTLVVLAPAISTITPAAPTPGTMVTLTGCYFGTQPSVQLTPSVFVSTQQSGYKNAGSALIQPANEQGGGGGYQSIAFQLPADTAAGVYSLAVVRNDGTASAGTPVTVASSSPLSLSAGASPSICGQPTNSTPVGLLNIQTQQYSSAVTPLIEVDAGAAASFTKLHQAPAGEAWASPTTQASIPVSGLQAGAILIWQDSSPQITYAQADDGNQARATADAAAAASPDGDVGSWQPAPNQQVLASCNGVSYVSVVLNPAVNYISDQDLIDQYQNLTRQYHPNLSSYVTDVFVPPVYAVTLKAVPYTIMYQPPGDLSTDNLTQSITSSIQYNIGNGTQASNSSTDEQDTCVSLGITVGPLTPSVQACQSTSTTSGNAFSQQWGQTSTYSDTTSNTWKIGPINSLVPAANASWSGSYAAWAETYADEPFWWDSYVFLLAPEYAVYDNAGTPVFRLIASSNISFSSPIPLAYLAACAAGIPAPTGSGFSPQGNPCDIGGAVLSPQEALSALGLDPLYPGGQGTDPTAGCKNGSGCRAQFLTYQRYTENANATGTGTTQVSSASASYSTSNTYNSSVTNSVTLQGGIQLKFDNFLDVAKNNVTGSATDQSKQSQTSGVTVTYQNSTLTSQSQSMALSLGFQDADDTLSNCKTCHPPLAPPPQGPFVTNVYLDNTFGTLIFTEPGAAPAPSSINILKQVLPGILTKMKTVVVRRNTYGPRRY